MAMMAKMRSLAPAFIITVGVLFVLFMVVSDSNVLQSLGGRPTNVGSVNGEEIGYQEFMNAIEQQREQRKQQTGEDIPEEQMSQFRDQVWDAVITQKLFAQQMEKYGIFVTDKEISDIILGDDPPQFLKQSFIDSTGKFNRQMYETAIYDPRNKDALLQAEEYVRQSQLNEKLQSLLWASITISENEIKRDFVENNTELNVKYAVMPFNVFPDSIINVTEDELQNYYEENLDQYKIDPQRKVKYVIFSKKPSAQDSASVQENLQYIMDSFKDDTLSFKEAVDIYSSQPYSKDTIPIVNLPVNNAEQFLNANAGDIIGPVNTRDGLTLYKLVNKINGNVTYANASHILINQNESDSANYEEAMRIYNELKSGANFGDMARQYSKDPGSAARGGNLGWFEKGRMVPEFENAVFTGPVGEVQKPVKTSFGYHIIKVNAKTNTMFVIEKIVKPIVASARTVDDILNAARDFAYLADKEGFEKAAEELNYEVKETPPFKKDAAVLPQMGNAKRVVQWTFDNDINDISQPFTIESGYTVVMVTDIIKEGVKPLEEVESAIKPLVRRELKLEKSKEVMQEVKSKIDGNLDKAKTINNEILVDETGKFKPSSSVPKVGRDNAFIQSALVLERNKVSDPVKGNRGYYLMKVLERTPFDSSAYAIQKNTIRDKLLREKKQNYLQQWVNKLKEQADIEDNRYVFFNQ